MFLLHDRVKRRIGIAAFFLFGIVPTAVILAWAAAWHSPWHAGAEARRLGRLLGLDVTLGAVHHPRPGVVRYEGLALADPETGRSVLQCPALEAANTTVHDSQGRPLLVLFAERAEVDEAELGRLRALLDRVLRRSSGKTASDARLLVHRLTIRRGDDDARAFTHVRADLRNLASEAEFSFQLAEQPADEPIRFRIVRDRRSVPPDVSFALRTGDTAVPCDVLAMGMEGFPWLGAHSRFRGQVCARRTAEGWEGELAGRVFDVELDRLVTDRFPHRLSGTAQVHIARARFRRGRLDEVAGSIEAGPGTISRSLLVGAVEQLGCVGKIEPSRPDRVVPYRRLALGFFLDRHGLRLEGQCQENPCSDLVSGAILTDARGRLLSEPSRQPRPVAALLRTLVPAGRFQAPVTVQTDWLARRLPLPDVMPVLSARSRGAWERE